MDDDALVGVIFGVENQGAQRRIFITLRAGQVLDDFLQDFVDVDVVLGRDQRRVAGIEADDFLDLLPDNFRLGGGQVDLVDDRQDFQVGVDRQVDIGQGLGFDALGGVDDQHGAVAGGQGARDFVVEVDMAGGVDQVQGVDLAVDRPCRPCARPGL